MDDMPDHPTFATPMNLIARALAKGVPVEKLGELLAFAREQAALIRAEEAYEAEKAFNRDMAAAAAEMPAITKSKIVDFQPKSGGRVRYKHEDLGEIIDLVRPVLARHGFKIHFYPVEDGERLKMICCIKHELGHTLEVSSYSAPRDDSGAKNFIQSKESTTSYLKRSALKNALALAGTSEDDDGRASEASPAGISTAEVTQIAALLGELEDDQALAKILTFAKVGELADIRPADFPRVLNWLRAKKQREVAAAAAQGEGS
jgi:hypothetical protein